MNQVLLITTIIANTIAYFGNPDKESSTHYHIYKGEKVIGHLLAESKISSQGYKLAIKSEINTRFLIEFQVKVLTENVMGPGQMISSFSERKINGNTKFKHVVEWKNGSYRSADHEGIADKVPQKIMWTTTSLYFKEPIGVTHVFSENYLQMIPLIPIAPLTYQLKFPDGRSSTFYYKDGRPYKVVSKTEFGEFTFKRSPVRENLNQAVL